MLKAFRDRNSSGSYALVDKDPEKSARTFITVDGKRYSCPGDYAVLEEDGKVTVLGRGSVCINTGGEKVFPEEVEEALKTHPSVEDALVVGVPDEKWGQAVTAVVQLAPGQTLDEHRWDSVMHPNCHSCSLAFDGEDEWSVVRVY